MTTIKYDITHEDLHNLYSAGRVWGKSLVLSADEDNIPEIQAGPEAMKLAVDYYAIALSDEERQAVLYEFHEGVRQFYHIDVEAILAMLNTLMESRR